MFKNLVVATFVLFCSSCSEENRHVNTSIFQLYDGAKHNGKKIVTSGFLTKNLGTSEIALFPYEIDAINYDQSRKIIIFSEEPNFLELIGKCTGEYVLVEGVFNMSLLAGNPAFIEVFKDIKLLKLETSHIRETCWKSGNGS